MAISRSSNYEEPSKRFEQELLEAERKRDVMLLLENLSKSQEATIKLILDCLYDVGSVRLINKKIHHRSLNRLTRAIANLSKPVFRVFAFRWFKKNCPELITNWLYKKISFEDSDDESTPSSNQPPPTQTVEVLRLESSPYAELDLATQEIRRLRSQVKWLRGISVGAIATLGITAIWLGYNFRLEPLRLINEPPQPVLDIDTRQNER
ncbi:MAG: hypothetical protein ACFE0J_08395 [Elainellaceae cyanobacterium]